MPAPKPSRLAILLDKIANENGVWADAAAARQYMLTPYGLEVDDVRCAVVEAMMYHRTEMIRIQKAVQRYNWEL